MTIQSITVANPEKLQTEIDRRKGGAPHFRFVTKRLENALNIKVHT
jgi:hypothetical protein